MREAGAQVIVTLGGDGTSRIVAKSADDVPLLSLSTGTNNVFPSSIEGTLAGLAAKAFASGWVSRNEACVRRPVLTLKKDGKPLDTALVDLVVVDGWDTGAKAVWDPESIRELFLTQAPPLAIGLAAIGSAVDPMPVGSAEGIQIILGENGKEVRAPIAPGLVATVSIEKHSRFKGELPILASEGVIALDGEREHVIDPSAKYSVSFGEDGPWVLDVEKALSAAARNGFTLANNSQPSSEPLGLCA
jgi:predicted polyphosphate/ATP-dependent NAD kinase